MKYAFDFGGTLSAHPEIQEIARALIAHGDECHVISATADEMEDGGVSGAVKKMGVPWTSINFVRHGPSTGDTGVKKVRVMQKLGCTVLIDDTPGVVGSVKNAGLLALQVVSQK